jgi:hypothetical protein
VDNHVASLQATLERMPLQPRRLHAVRGVWMPGD